MDWKHLLTSFEGRIARKAFWFGVLALTGFITVAAFLIGFVGAAQDIQMAMQERAIHLIQIAALFPLAAVLGKRLHDRGRPASLAMLFLVPVGMWNLLYLLAISDPNNPSAFDHIASVVAGVVSIWFLVDLGLLKGTPGPNRYGPDPLGERIVDARMEA